MWLIISTFTDRLLPLNRKQYAKCSILMWINIFSNWFGKFSITRPPSFDISSSKNPSEMHKTTLFFVINEGHTYENVLQPLSSNKSRHFDSVRDCTYLIFYHLLSYMSNLSWWASFSSAHIKTNSCNKLLDLQKASSLEKKYLPPSRLCGRIFSQLA